MQLKESRKERWKVPKLTKVKEEKGITIIALVLTIIMVLAVAATLVYYLIAM